MIEQFTDQDNCLSESYGLSNPQLIDLLMTMLEYNPIMRPTAAHLLSCNVFDSIRNKDLESSIEHMGDNVSIDFDQDKAVPLAEDLNVWRKQEFVVEKRTLSKYR